MMRVVTFFGDGAGVLAAVLFVPVAVLLVGLPVALAMRFLLAILERL